MALLSCGGTPAEPRAPAAPAAGTATASAAAVAPAALPTLLTAERLMAHVRALTAEELEGRQAGTAGERLAADYVVAELEAASVAGLHGGYLHPFEMAPGVQSLNVVGVIAGRGPRRGEHVVLGAHLDHLGRRGAELHLGAEDNASGVAVVLEIAALLVRRQSELDRSVAVAFFGAEEAGLLGAKHFVSQPPVAAMAAMVNIDMIGRPLVDMAVLRAVKLLAGIDDRRAMGVLGTAGRPHFRRLVDEACHAEGIEPWAPEDLPGPMASFVERVSRDRGDSFPFEAAGVPALFFGQGESDDYHQPSDTADKLDPEGLAARGRAIARVVVGLSQPGS
jgi:Zn-dependent M28 family amino/carboxypeptidase